jgi:DNA-binding MarR family transcriptional regulator
VQLLHRDGNGANGIGQDTSPDVCAQQILDVVPPVVRVIRRIMRSHRLPGLSVPQFRILALLNFSPEASLSLVAEYVDSSLPAASRLVNGLVAKKLITRCECDRDRRQISLKLTNKGQAAFCDSRRATRRQLADSVSALSPAQRRRVCDAMELLGGIFGSDAKCPAASRRKTARGRQAASGIKSVVGKA